jgi:error-prone DNA polymerase
VFTHLHVHTHFSFGIGASSPDALAHAARARGFTTLACTDTNGVYGAMEFQEAVDTVGIRPILGAHLVHGEEATIALAENEAGWAALCRAISAIHWQGNGKAEKPGKHGSFSLAGQLAHDRHGLLLLSSSTSLLQDMVQQSGPDNLFAELIPGKQRHAVLAAARRLGIPPVATNGVVVAHAEDWARHRLLRAISLNTALSACPPGLLAARDAWLRPAADLNRLFPDCPEAVTNAAAIAERCQYRIPRGRVIPPRLAAHEDAMGQLRQLAYEGAARRYGTIAPVTRDRLEHELGIIAMKGYADYFLVVRDIVQHGPTHCGRGSVANSVVSYCLGITHVEPLGAGLLFERFLNPERTDPPDIDLDFPWDERDQVLAYVFQRYPLPRAAMVANHNCFRLRGALREVAKVHGRPPGEIREVTRRIPWWGDDDSTLSDMMQEHPNFRSLELPGIWADLARMAEPLVGIPRHLSLHPGGVVIVPTALTDYVPIEPAVKTLEGHPDLTLPVIQFEKDGAEDAGLVKIDLLGNRSLAVIRDAIEAVHHHIGKRIDYTSSEAGDDPKTRALFRTGQTMGVFYTESPASRQLCQKSQAESFDLLVLNTSIIRPASNRYIRVYLERLHGKPYEPLDPILRDTLSETFGVMVYQEDVVNVCAMFAGMPLATGDGLRKALSQKRPGKRLAAYAGEFFAGAAALGRNPETTQKVWDMVMSFAGYSFCKGHSCSYIQVAQHSCYLRANHPAEFFAAVLSNGGGFYHPFAYIAEARRNGICILPPDVNASDFRCIGREGWLRVGLQFIKGLTSDGVERLLAGRDGGAAGPYRDIQDLQERARLSHDDVRMLIKVGALDSISGGKTRPMMLWEIDESARRPDTGNPLLPCCPADPPPRLKEYNPERQRREQYESLGFTTNCHPMDLHAEALQRFRLVRSTELQQHVGQHVLAAGMLTTAKPVHTAKDEPMEFATFDDGPGLIETVLFPDVYRERGHVLFDQGPFIFQGKVEMEFGAITLTITQLDRLERMSRRLQAG